LYSREEAEGTRLRHPADTIAEGVGLNRLTGNFLAALEAGCVDGAVRVSDREAVEMAAYLLRCACPGCTLWAVTCGQACEAGGGGGVRLPGDRGLGHEPRMGLHLRAGL
jgi:hypothetical protein